MMQQIGRGKVRNIDNQAVAGEMTAYVLTEKAERFTKLRVQYKGCQVQQLAYQNNSVKKLTGQVAQVIEQQEQQSDTQS